MAQLGLDYPTQWGRGYAARIFREIFHSYVLSPVIRYLSTLTVIGDENIKGPGPFIFVANHASHLDTALLLTAMPDPQRRRTVVAAAMDNFFMESGRAFRTVLFFNAVPVDRQKVNRRSAQLLQELVEDGWNLVIFPEGGRTPDGDLQEFKGGAAFLAQKANATVIPTYIHEAGKLQGARFAKAPAFKKFDKWRHPVVVSFGEGIRSEVDENVRAYSARIEEAVLNIARDVSQDPTMEITREDDSEGGLSD